MKLVILSRFGRRKSWIVPIQIVIAVLMIYLGSEIDELLSQVTFAFLNLILGNVAHFISQFDVHWYCLFMRYSGHCCRWYIS